MKDGYMHGEGNSGNMSPVVENYQPKTSEYAGEQEGKTTQYISKRDKIQTHEAGKVKSNAYKGRYD